MEPAEQRDGFTLVELLIVIVVLGILSTVVVVSVVGIVDRGEDARCDGDVRSLAVAAEAYFAEHGGNVIPPTGVDADRYERTLMLDGFVHEASTLHDMESSGEVIVKAGSPCTTI